jgi:hypothetical protein
MNNADFDTTFEIICKNALLVSSSIPKNIGNKEYEI